MSKYAFLRSNASLIIIGLLVGMLVGFKIANTQYRSRKDELLNRAVAQTASGMPNQRNADSSNQNMKPEEADRFIKEVTEIIDKAKANPNDAEAQMEAASQFIQIERPEEAMPFLQQADKAKPNDPRINAGLGVAYFMMERLDEATSHLKRSRDLGAVEPTVTSLLIGSYIQTGKNLDEAERLLKELEAKGINPSQLARIRKDLNAARLGKSENPGATSGSKSVLDHGPENKPPRPGGKN